MHSKLPLPPRQDAAAVQQNKHGQVDGQPVLRLVLRHQILERPQHGPRHGPEHARVHDELELRHHDDGHGHLLVEERLPVVDLVGVQVVVAKDVLWVRVLEAANPEAEAVADQVSLFLGLPNNKTSVSI